MKPWMWLLLAVALLLVLFDIDPVGDNLNKMFGKHAAQMAINFILIAIAGYLLFKNKKK